MSDTELQRVREAYLRMAREAKYRPQAPSDGFGNIQLTEKELQDPERLDKEASEYARRFIKEENSTGFHIGVSDYRTNRALVFTIEAARLLCGPHDSHSFALKLLEMAVEEAKEAAQDLGR